MTTPESTERPGRLGKLSIGFAGLAVVLQALVFAVYGKATSNVPLGSCPPRFWHGVAYTGFAVAAILAVAGMILGARSLRKKESKPGLAQAGVGFSALFLLSSACLFCMLLVSLGGVCDTFP